MLRIFTFLDGFANNGSEYQKTFLKFKYAGLNWFNAKATCISFGLDLASFETLPEAQAFIKMAIENDFIKSNGITHLIIDGMANTPKSTTD